jgi:methionyl-tRNA formyltransferase
MKISVICSDKNHPVMPYLRVWRDQQTGLGHTVELVSAINQLTSGDFLFLVSCSEILEEEYKKLFRHSFVLHASDLPKGRGWSPYIWNILEGKSIITVCLLEAASPVDSGDIWHKRTFTLDGHELLPEIHEQLFQAELSLIDDAIGHLDDMQPILQDENMVSHFPRRSPEDSRLDPNKTIAEQFDLLRVVDSDRFPAFFELRGKRYRLMIEKDD